jgi:hypothetical protein
MSCFKFKHDDYVRYDPGHGEGSFVGRVWRCSVIGNSLYYMLETKGMVGRNYYAEEKLKSVSIAEVIAYEVSNAQSGR